MDKIITLLSNFIVPIAIALVGGGIVLFLMKKGWRRERVEVQKLDIENIIQVNKYLLDDNDAWKMRYSELEKELARVNMINKEQKKIIEGYEEEIRLLKIQRTLWKTINT